MALSLPPLPYAFDALEPVIDATTMEIHHGKHHAAYVAKANDALAGSDWADRSVEDIVRSIESLPDAIRGPVRNNAGGHYNHALFWTAMAPKDHFSTPAGDLADAIDRDFGSFDDMQEKFAVAAATRFGSGWAWLVSNKGTLSICSTANQDNPLMGEGIAGCSGTPILGLDVWEHAYYLNYQNRRPDYVAAWWDVVNWDEVTRRFDASK